MVGCSASLPETTDGDNSPLAGGTIGGHPLTVILESEGAALIDGPSVTAELPTIKSRFCTGMLVRSNLILTAGHCMQPSPARIPLPEHTFRFFNHTTSQIDERFAWREVNVFRHPTADVAFIHLPRSVRSPELAHAHAHLNLSELTQFPREAKIDGNHWYEANGQGFKRHNDDTVTAALRLSSIRETFAADFSSDSELSPHRYWAYVSSWSDAFAALTQPGDSGGPLYVPQTDGSAWVLGVTSQGGGPALIKVTQRM